ncbi:MAG TPA: HAMP domain-containing sensor histidine kinase [Chitinophagaceae bacterium]
MKPSIIRYIVISVICFLTLAAVQFFLVSNTYELKNERYYFSEKGQIRESYSKLIRNDKLFPGGGAIIDSFILPRLNHLALIYKSDPRAFEVQKQRLSDSLFGELRKKESIQEFLQCFRKAKHVKDSLVYGLMIESLSLVLEKEDYVTVYDKRDSYPLIESSIQEEDGIRIGGTLRDLNEQNKIVGLAITGTQPNSYRISFRLYVEPQSRKSSILQQMTFTFILSLASILIILLLFFVTFRNWLRQKKLSEMKSDFINNITHELHTPLAAIIVANKNLQNEKIIEKKENIGPLTDVIQRQSDRLRMLIDEVLDIVATDKITLDKKDYHVNDLLDEILLDYRLKLAGTKVKLHFNKEAVNDKIALDKFHFTTMLLNIFDNALKYNDKELKTLTVSTENGKQTHLQIRIGDNGIGMSKETIRNIFDKFYRSSTQLITQAKGLGLGLYYARQSAQAHNWEIAVESKPGEGSTFIISIPS